MSCPKPESTSSLTLPPVEDAVIKEEYSNRNFAYLTSLNSKSGAGSKVDSLLKFMFHCVYTEPIVSRAVLSLYCMNGAPTGGKIEVVSGVWSEDKVTWNSAEESLSSTNFSEDIGRVRKGHWVQIDVTEAVTSMDGYWLTFRIEGTLENVAVYGAKEDVEYAPKLEIFF